MHNLAYPIRSFLLVTLLTCAQSSVVADEVDASGDRHEEAVRLVQQLGNEQFSVRERATTRLIQMGPPARRALEAARNHADREIRYRCERILSIVGELDFEQRLDAFSAGRSQGEDLPAWDSFREQFGDSSRSRELFVQMQEAESELLQAVEDEPQSIERTVDQRCLVLQHTQRIDGDPVTLGSIAALLFAASKQDTDLSMQATSVLYTLCRQPTMANAMNDPAKQEILRQMLGQWIEHSQGWAAYQTLFLAMQYGLKEGLTPALKLLENAGEQAYARQQAILTVARLGDASHAGRLEALLGDQSRCSAQRINNVTFETQIRDVALAAILILQKQDPKEFGFRRIQRDSATVFATNTVGFESEDRRSQVFAKYQKFQVDRAKTD